ncbi:MAG: hypothetical protein WCK02_03405 [Bacteroidota bacterium]
MESAILKLLKTDSSTRIIEEVRKLVRQDSNLFDYIVDLSFNHSYPVSMRAARVVQFCCEENHYLIKPRLAELLPLAFESKVEGVKRSYIKVISEIIDINDVPDLGYAFGKCFDCLLDHKEAIAIRVYCMEFVYRVSLIEPDLQSELIEVLNKELLDCSAGFKSRATKIINKLNRK